jgi:hypothetical protein
MSVLAKISFYQGRRDEVPNQELARELAQQKDRDGLREIADNLWNNNPNIQSDCLKVLYETSYLAPELVADYTGDFLQLLNSRNNRLVWGGMIALAAIAPIRSDQIYQQVDQIIKLLETGSVITVDNAVKVLSALAAANHDHSLVIFPRLLHHLEFCRPDAVARHAEYSLPAVNTGNKTLFLQVLEKRMIDLRGAQVTRVKKIIQQADR